MFLAHNKIMTLILHYIYKITIFLATITIYLPCNLKLFFFFKILYNYSECQQLNHVLYVVINNPKLKVN